MIIIDGKKLTKKIYENIELKLKESNRQPVLNIILIGDNPSSKIYIRTKTKKAEELGIKVKVHDLTANTNPEEIFKLQDNLNKSKECTGYFIQLPLPRNYNEIEFFKRIVPEKDIDCLNPLNQGKILQGNSPVLYPATLNAVIKILKSLDVNLEGKNCVVVNHSNMFGKPMAAYLIDKNATVTVCHEFTKDLKSFTKEADILISATGKANLIKADMVKPNSIVIDVGISKTIDKTQGDVDFDDVKNKVKAITPVPGGVGPITVACLLENVVKVFLQKSD